jgi:hypothetical protein
MTRRGPLMIMPSITVPFSVIVIGPVYSVRVVPAGTPVFVALGYVVIVTFEVPFFLAPTPKLIGA